MRTKTEIVILNWNGAGHLRRFLPSVLASVPEGVGVVVADKCNGCKMDDRLGTNFCQGLLQGGTVGQIRLHIVSGMLRGWLCTQPPDVPVALLQCGLNIAPCESTQSGHQYPPSDWR